MTLDSAERAILTALADGDAKTSSGMSVAVSGRNGALARLRDRGLVREIREAGSVLWQITDEGKAAL